MNARRDLALELPLSGVFLVEASAGTGKTFALTAWMLRLLLEAGVPLPRLLAVTFTRAATAELRQRLRKRLRGAARLLGGEPPWDDESKQTLAILERARAEAGDAQLRRRLESARLQLDEAAVFTIHGFCQRALREFGFLAGALDEGELIDDAGEAWREVAADLWRAAGNGEAEAFARLSALWATPETLARDLPKLCDPARRLLPKADASEAAAWLQRLREDAALRFARALQARRQRSQDQLIERVWQASAQPRFAAALARRWPLVLVDEFQDTDLRQWDIFRRVFEARTNAGEAETRGLFLVGDPKQAIYRFRGGDLPTYLEAREYARAHGGEATLDVNYRSRPAVLRGIETLFARNAAPFVERGIEFIHVEPAERNRGMRLRVGDEAVPGVCVQWLPPDKPNANARSQELAVCATVNDIARLLERGTLADAKGERRVRAEDIGVLVRTNPQAETMREALARAGIAAAVQGSASVFASEAACELSCLLHACAVPSDSSRVRAALATRLLGNRARDIAALDDSGAGMAREQQRFEQAAQAWRQRGPLPALLPFLGTNAATLLSEDGGARLLTDALHLAELLQAESPMQHGIGGLLRWFERQCAAPEKDEAQALRMESDARAVQVMTLHKSKGLEFPLVFMPFAAFAGGGGNSDSVRKTLARDEDGAAAIYVHCDKGGVLRAGEETHRRMLEAEARAALAEDMRLFYVGLTRAAQAVHFSAGGSRTQDFKAAPLKWLLLGDEAIGSGKGETKTADARDAMRARLEALAGDTDNDGLRLLEIPSDLVATTLHVPQERDEVRPAREALRQLRAGGGQYSFSGLRARHAETLPARGADDEIAGIDVEGGDAVLRGAAFGNAVHAVLEAADFAGWRGLDTAPASADESLRQALERFGLPQTPAARAQVATLAARALNAPLPGIDTLSELDPSRRVPEMEFHFRLGHTRLPELDALLEAHGYPRDTATRSGGIEGLMHGYIDLVYRDDDGGHVVVDYKTNTLAAYSADACARAVRDNEYDLQYLIYLVALQRWLRLRLGAGYDPQRHLGGAVYLFLRGLDADGNGIHRDRPPQRLIDALDALFDGGAS